MTRRIIVVGGGIAGLAATHRLIELSKEKSLDIEVMLLEASSSTWRDHCYGAGWRFPRRSRSGFLYHGKALGASFVRALGPHLTPGINPSGVSKNLRGPQR